MPESIGQRMNAIADHEAAQELRFLIDSLRADVEAIRVQLNTHIHSGVTVGAGNTAAPTTTIAALNTQR